MVRPFLTTPSGLSKVASRYFLDAQPSLWEEGTRFISHWGNSLTEPRLQFVAFGMEIST